MNSERSQASNSQRNSDDISLAEMMQNISSGISSLNQIDKEIVLILGDTGSGKTTLGAFLCNVNLLVQKNDCGETILDYSQSDSKRYGKIGSSSVFSETTIPQKFERNGAVFWDTPGFCDSNGEGMQIVNSFLINKITNDAQRIKFILAINGDCMIRGGSSRNDSLKKLYQSFFFMVQDKPVNIEEHTLVIITKAQINKSGEQYQNYLNKVIEEYINPPSSRSMDSEDNCSQQMKKFLKSLSRAQLQLFYEPRQNNEVNSVYNGTDRNLIIQKLNQVKYCSNENIKIPFSKNLQRRIEVLWRYTQYQIKQYFETICESLSQLIKEFTSEQCEELNIIITNAGDFNQSSSDAFFELINENFLNEIIRVCKHQEQVQIPEIIDQSQKQIQFFYSQIFKGMLEKTNIENYDSSSFFTINQVKDGIKKIGQSNNERIETIKLIKDLSGYKIIYQEQQQKIEQINHENEELNSKIENLSHSKNQSGEDVKIMLQQLTQQLQMLGLQMQQAQDERRRALSKLFKAKCKNQQFLVGKGFEFFQNVFERIFSPDKKK